MVVIRGAGSWAAVLEDMMDAISYDGVWSDSLYRSSLFAYIQASLPCPSRFAYTGVPGRRAVRAVLDQRKEGVYK